MPGTVPEFDRVSGATAADRASAGGTAAARRQGGAAGGGCTRLPGRGSGGTASGSGHSSASATAHFGGARKVARIAYTLSLERPTTFRRAGGPERATRVDSGEEIGETGQEQQRSATAEKTPQKARFQSRDLRPQAGDLGVYLGGQDGQVATGDGLVAARQSVVTFRSLIDRGHRWQATGCVRRRSTPEGHTCGESPIGQRTVTSASLSGQQAIQTGNQGRDCAGNQHHAPRETGLHRAQRKPDAVQPAQGSEGRVPARLSASDGRRLLMNRRPTGAQPTAASADLPITQKALAAAGTLPSDPDQAGGCADDAQPPMRNISTRSAAGCRPARRRSARISE